MTDWGVLFRMNADGSSYSVLHHFTKKEGANPSGGLIEASDGKLYGVSRGIEGFPPVVFSFDKLTGSLQMIYEFAVETDRLYPIYILQASNGHLYGLCERGNSGGMIFRIDLSNHEFEKLADLPSVYVGNLLEASDGALYGVLRQTQSAGASIYKINLDGSGFATTFEFGSVNASNPSRGMIEGPDGYLYGTASLAGNSVIYKVKKDGSGFSALHNFSFQEGYAPSSGQVLGADGLLYGFTTAGAAFGKGAFYRINPDGTNFEIMKHLASDFESISSAPTQTEDGSFYATSWTANGVIHKFSLGGTYSKVKNFPEAIDHPYQLFPTKSNDIFGISRSGGAKGQGGIFKVEKDGTHNLTVVYQNGVTDEAIFNESLTVDNAGNLFAPVGGFANGIGKLLPDYSVERIYQFPDNTFTWASRGPLFFASDEFLYGISAGGGAHAKGTLYRMKSDGSEFSIVHSFEESTIARQPVQFESNGYLYGVCNGGINGRGSIYRFKMTTNDFERIFDFTTDFGSTSFGYLKLMKGSDDMIYGLATTGGPFGKGLVFKMALDGSGFEELRSFSVSNQIDEWLPTRILEGPDLNLYGITALGGEHNTGVIFTMKKDGSEYRKIFDLPEELDLRFLAEVDVSLISKIPHQISFSLPSDTLRVSDQSVTLMASSDAGLPITFSSSDTSLVKIQGSTLNILGVGEVTITAQQQANQFYTRSATSRTLYIKKGDQIVTFDPITSLAISDNYFDLAATSSSGLPITYSTESDNISIEGNRVRLLSPGRATIIARQQGDNNYNAVSIERSFCINPPKPVISDDRVGSRALLLTSSSDAGNQWYFNGTEIPGATEKTLQIGEDGIYTVKTTMDDCSSESSEGYASIVTGLESSAEWDVKIYPNPTAAQLTVELANNFHCTAIAVIDVFGRTVMSGVGENRKEVFDLRTLPEGLYFVQLTVEDQVYYRRIVKRGSGL